MKTASLFLSFCMISILLLSPVLTDCITANPNYYLYNIRWGLRNGSGQIVFQGKGNDAQIRIINQMYNSSYQYWIQLAGWNNTMSRVSRGDGSVVCDIPQSLDLTRTYQYKFLLNPSASRIRLLLDDVEAWTCVDPKGWNAPAAQYFSISRWYPDMSFCNLVSSPYVDEGINNCLVLDPTKYTYSADWNIGHYDHGGFYFIGYGSGIALKLSNQQDDSSYQYSVVIGGGITLLQRYTGETVLLFALLIKLLA
jgi:hypothetical protein